MRTIGNILWFVLGGALMGALWWMIGFFCVCTVVGIPWARSCFVIGSFTFWPFGREPISRNELNLKDDIGTGPLGFLGNVIWFIFAGFWLALGHIFAAVANFITIYGIPFGIQHLKLAAISLAPIGMTVVTTEEAAAARMANAKIRVARRRR